MAPIEEYALLSDLQTAALVARNGSIDWCCFPRFDSGACFAALLGGPEHGRWLLAPAGETRSTRRRYRPGTLVLETEHETAGGVVRVTDFMPPRNDVPDIVRIVEGLEGTVAVVCELVLRFDYGRIVPWVQQGDGGLAAIAGPDAVSLRSPVSLRGRDLTSVAEFDVAAGQRVPFVLTWYPSHRSLPEATDAELALAEAEDYWTSWTAQCTYDGPHRDAVEQSLRVLKGLTFAPTGGIVAAPTTSLPERIGGTRNWDYRFCWLRDAALTLTAMLRAGYAEEAEAWRHWLLRAIAGSPADIQIMYGIAGERRLDERELEWLPGYEGSRPVRIGNAASQQPQLDVYGEVIDAMVQARGAGAPAVDAAWALLLATLERLESGWRDVDAGIWEVRGPERHFTHSKVMAWVAFDRAVRAVERFGREGPVERWRAAADAIRAEVLERAWSEAKQAFAQSYDSDELDASVLLMSLAGFLPPDDDRMVSTVAAIERELVRDGFVMRYLPRDDGAVDGLSGDEGAFLPCSFWLASVLAQQGRLGDAERLFERLLGLCNDLGLVSEEYDTKTGRLVGNFPQAFTHLELINTAFVLDEALARA
ncbi:MAG TPA: glycoside hydrolase family 15 protein [Gaiellaceae bacterium]|nr:glycoside hydrolase family 15 protein [Gaiellaceae bacterium]